jgi:MFS superfamily sulfate permease-like transporter
MGKTFPSDLLASLVVFLVAVPLCLGIAIASGTPPATGLITGIVGGIVVGFFAGCPLQVSGPAAGLTVLVYQIVQEHGLAMLGPIVLAGGLMQLAAGAVRAGQLFRAISPAVIHGMLAGIGVLIFGSQMHVLVDHVPKPSGLKNLATIPESFALIFQDTDHDHHMAAIVGFATLAVIIAWNTIARGKLKLVPSALLGVITGTAIASAMKLNIHYVKLPASLVGAMSFPDAEGMQALLRPDVLTEAAALAFIASAETLLCAAAVDQMLRGKSRTDYDKELRAQGIGNTICGVLGALPMTGVIVRSTANINAGGQTRVSAIFHGIWILLVVAGFPELLQLVPTASLAAVLVHIGIKLVNFKMLRHLNQYGWDVAAITILTTVMIVCTSLLTGILVGIVLSILKLLWSISKLEVKVDFSKNREKVDVRLEGSASFISLPRLQDALNAVPQDVEAHVHIHRLNYIDHACMEAVSDWEKQRSDRGQAVKVEWNELRDFYQKGNVIQSPLAKKLREGAEKA